jgi:hypothetical protein
MTMRCLLSVSKCLADIEGARPIGLPIGDVSAKNGAEETAPTTYLRLENNPAKIATGNQKGRSIGPKQQTEASLQK